MGNVKNICKKGSFTIEAACLMSMILLIIFGVLYLCFFVHHRGWLTAAAYEAAWTGSTENVKEQGDAKETALRRANMLIEMPVLGAQNLEAKVTEEGKKIRVSYQADTISVYGGFHWKLKTKGEASMHDPVKTIRLLREGGKIKDAIGE